MKKVVFALLGILLILLLVAPASAWLAGFNYEKDIVLNSTSPSTLTSYQTKFVVWNTSGTDSGQNIYLDGHLTQPDTWNDIRFATTTDAICDIWIQEYNATAAVIWVEVPYIYNGYTTVRCYYGKPVATAVTDGDATFRFYGTFAVVPLNVDKWTGVGNYTLYNDVSGNSVASIWENATSGDSSITSIDTFTYATGYEQVIRANLTQYPTTLVGLYTNDGYYAYFGMSREVNNSLITETRIAPGTGNSQETTIGTGYGGAFHIWKIKRSQTGASCLFTIDNVAVANHTLKVPTASMPMSFRSTAVNGNVVVDWAFVKKYYDPEPYVAYTNPETVEAAPHTDFEGSPTFGVNGTTVYFTDLSTGVITARNWSFGDGVYSELQNPNHTYNTAGFYNVSLTASNSNGTDTQMKEDYIYIWSSITPTPTPTSNTTILTQVVIEPPEGSAYFPIEFYVVLIFIAMVCFFLSIMTRVSDDIMGILAAVFFLVLSWLSMAVDFHGITATNVNSTLVVQPYSYTPYIPYLTYIWLMLFFVSLLNLYRIWHLKMVEAVERKEQKEEDEFREEKQRRGF